MHTIYIDFVRPYRWFVPVSWLIRAVEGVPYSHLYVAFSEEGEDKVFQSVLFRGVEEVAFDKASAEYKLCHRFKYELTDIEFKILRDFCSEQKGKPYPIPQLVGILLAKMFGFKKNLFSTGGDKVVCAELVLKLMRLLPRVFKNQQLLKDVDPDLVGLLDIYLNLSLPTVSE